VVERCHLLFSGTPYSKRFTQGELLTAAEQASFNRSIALWRERLMDISWFMKNNKGQSLPKITFTGSINTPQVTAKYIAGNKRTIRRDFNCDKPFSG
jgi:hypothetical protein